MEELTPEQILGLYNQTGNVFYSSGPKPICVIYLPENFPIYGRYNEDAPMELMRALNNNFGDPGDGKRTYPDYWTQYYWFCFTKYGQIEAPEFKVFHPKDFTEIQFNELKDMILADLESMKHDSTIK